MRTDTSTGQRLAVRVSSALYADVLERAAAEERSLSGLVRFALRRHLQETSARGGRSDLPDLDDAVEDQ